jgi:hypothetical protein
MPNPKEEPELPKEVQKQQDKIKSGFIGNPTKAHGYFYQKFLGKEKGFPYASITVEEK